MLKEDCVPTGDCRPTREKYWGEKNDSEKILELKSELMRTQKTIEKLCQLTCQLLNHQHGANNNLLTEINAFSHERTPIFFRPEKFLDEGGQS
jgi:hypothetical protein